jgi:hypothetical protein
VTITKVSIPKLGDTSCRKIIIFFEFMIVEIEESGSVQKITDPDPGGPKSNGILIRKKNLETLHCMRKKTETEEIF